MRRYAAPLAGPGLGDRGLRRDRQTHRGPAAGRWRGRRRRPAEAVGASPGLRDRAGPQDRRHRRALGRAGRDPDDADCGRWSTTSSSRCCGSWSTGVARWVRSTPARPLSCTSCCSSSSLAGRSGTCPRPRPRRCWPRSGRRDVVGKTRRRVAASSSLTWSGSTPARRPRTRNSPNWSTDTGTTPAGPARHRTHRRSPAAGRGRRHHPVPEPRRTSRPGTAPRRSTPPQATRSGTGCREAGNRQINRVLHTMARVQLRNPTEGRDLLRPQEGRRQSPDGSDALRQAPTVRHRLPDHAQRRRPRQARGRAREDNGDNDSDSSATGSHPRHRLFGQVTDPRPCERSRHGAVRGLLDGLMQAVGGVASRRVARRLVQACRRSWSR